VIDFGSSCFEHEKSRLPIIITPLGQLTMNLVYTYIQSRFYRSPEVILGMNYHMAIDMWSLGCILAELYTGFPIFPGENEQEQLSCIMEVLGVPEKEYVNRSSRKKLFFGTSPHVPRHLQSHPPFDRSQRFTKSSDQFERPSTETRDEDTCASSALH